MVLCSVFKTKTLTPEIRGIGAQKHERVSRQNLLTLVIFGRDGGIRTHDPLHPMQVRYQAALRPDKNEIIARLLGSPQHVANGEQPHSQLACRLRAEVLQRAQIRRQPTQLR